MSSNSSSSGSLPTLGGQQLRAQYESLLKKNNSIEPMGTVAGIADPSQVKTLEGKRKRYRPSGDDTIPTRLDAISEEDRNTTTLSDAEVESLFGRKLEARWHAPFRIARVLNGGRSVILNEIPSDLQFGKYHTDHVKLFVPRNEARIEGQPHDQPEDEADL